VFFLFSVGLKHFSFSEEFIKILSQMYIGFHVKYLLFFSDLNLDSLEFSWHIFKKYSNIKFHENPFRASWVVACDRHDKANSHFLQFCELAFKAATHFNPKKTIFTACWHLEIINVVVRTAQSIEQLFSTTHFMCTKQKICGKMFCC